MPDVPASGFAIFFVLCFFFIFMAWAFMGSLAFTVGCAAGPVVWAEATDTLPTRAAQHAATIRFRILISRLVKQRLTTGHSRKGSMLGTAGDSRSNEPGGNELSDHAQEQTAAYRSHEHATCQARRDHADTSVADDADGRKGNEGSGTQKTTDPDGSGPRGESENNAPGIAAEAAGCPKYRALVSGVDFPIKVPKVGHPHKREFRGMIHFRFTALRQPRQLRG